MSVQKQTHLEKIRLIREVLCLNASEQLPYTSSEYFHRHYESIMEMYQQLTESNMYVEKSASRPFVIYASYCVVADGLSEIAWRFVRLLREKGFTVCSFQYYVDNPKFNISRLRLLIQRAKQSPVFVYHGTYDMNLYSILDFLKIANIPTVGYLTWETTLLPTPFLKPFQLFDRIIVPSFFNKDTFDKSLTIKSSVVYHVFNPPTIDDQMILDKYASETTVFYTINNSNDTRKNFYDTVIWTIEWLQCQKEKRGSQKSQREYRFVVKGYPGECMQKIMAYVLERGYLSWVTIYADTFTEEQIAALHTQGGVFVSLTHGEGVGMNIIDAIQNGNLVIAPKFSGYVEYIGNEYPFWIKCSIQDIESVTYEHPDLSPTSYFKSPQKWSMVTKSNLFNALDILHRSLDVSVSHLLDINIVARRNIRYLTAKEQVISDYIRILHQVRKAAK